MNDLDQLKRIVDAVRAIGANIAPTYEEYYPLAYGIAGSCGEAGREYFHVLCSFSPKYKQTDADKFYNYALRAKNNRFTLGSVYHLAERAGLKFEKEFEKEAENTKPCKPCKPCGPSHTHTRTLYTENEKEDQLPEDLEEFLHAQQEKGADPFPVYTWPDFLQRIISCTDYRPHQDILLLSALTTLGSTINRMLYYFYNNQKHHPTLQTIIIGSAASGKSIVSWVRQIARPFQEELDNQYMHEMDRYRIEKQAYDVAGKKREKMQVPEKPCVKLFLIPGNNSATGIKELLALSGGVGLIFETETDTISSAMNTDYGHWSDTMRKGYDGDEIAYYRKTDQEYRHCDNTCLSMVNTGTPAQLANLIPSREDGTFSRILSYRLPGNQDWINQFGRSEDYKDKFHGWGVLWKEKLDTLRKSVSSIQVKLTQAQMEAFNGFFSDLYHKAEYLYSDTMLSCVKRLGLNVGRMLCVVCLMRLLGKLEDLPSDPEKLLQELLKNELFKPADNVHPENVKDSIVTSYELTANDEDFQAVLNLANPLVQHISQMMRLLPEVSVNPQVLNTPQKLFNLLPSDFTRADAIQAGETIGLKESSVDALLTKMKKEGIIEATGRGTYRFTAKSGKKPEE